MNTVQFAFKPRIAGSGKRCDLIRVEELLRQGADPLGSFDVNHQNEHILGELFCFSADDEKLADRMPTLLRLFLLMEWILQPEIFRVMRKIISTRYGT